MSTASGGTEGATPKPFYAHLYVQVLTAIIIGAAFGKFFPQWGTALEPLGTGFIKLIKMMIAPIVFATVVLGIGKMGDMRAVGRVGVKALFYFEVVTTIALAIGMGVAHLIKPGLGIHADPTKLDQTKVVQYAEKAKATNATDMLLHVIPDSVVGAFADGEILQVLLFSVLFGAALGRAGERGKPVLDAIDRVSHLLFDVIGIIMRAAPIGAFGAMAFTIGKYGLGTLVNLGQLMACVYVTCLLFIFVVLGTIARVAGFSIAKLIYFIREELLIVLGTSSSESALPRLMEKLERAGASRPVVGLVVPTGYSFNLDGTSIYLTMAALFIAQATDTPLTLRQELTIMAILLLTSKGAAAVTGGGFVTLAATLAAVDTIPVAGLALLVGIDRFMSEARAITNLIGNAVATLVVAKWEKALDQTKLDAALSWDAPLEEGPTPALRDVGPP